MSEIIKTRAIVLRKINFGDSSRIAHFFTEDFGKLSAIVKGARSPKSKIGAIVDTLNIVEIVFYKKENRELQVVSQIDLIHHFKNIRDDFDRYKYALAIVELISELTLEYEPHRRLFNGSFKILVMLNETINNPQILFVKYFLFFIKEIGYELQLLHCNICNKIILENEAPSYNYETGLMCSNCSANRLTNFNFSKELFNFLICLSQKKEIIFKQKDIDQIIIFFEKFLSYHVTEFKGLTSLKMI